MAKRVAVSQQELFEVANRLYDEGKEVTAISLLKALGGGSLTTIYKYLEIWQKDRPVSGPANNIDLPEVVKNSFASSWRVAVAEANREIEALREQAAEEVKAAERKFQEALEAIATLEKESEADAEQIEKLSSRITELEGNLSVAQAEIAASKTLAEQLQKQLEAQAKEMIEIRAGKEEALKTAAALEGRLAELKQQNGDLMERLTKSEPPKE